MSKAWQQLQLGVDTEGVLSTVVAAGNVTSLVAPRQFLPDVTLDVPTLMATVVVFTFLVQFFFTVVSINLAAVASSSSSLSRVATTTATTTNAPTTMATAAMEVLRTQTVTPAPAPDWRLHPQGPYGLQRLWRRSANPLPFPAWHRHVSHPLPSQPWDIPHYFGVARGSFDRPQVASRSTLPPEGKAATEERRTGPRRMPLLYEVEDMNTSGEAVGMLDPLTLSSHRVSLVSDGAEAGQTDTVGMVSSVLYGAERWGDRLQEWNILSTEGAQALTQTLLMVRCAFISPDFCAKLDHYFRRQHDLNLVAAMMNHHSDYEDHDPLPADKEPPAASRPEREKNPGNKTEAGGDDREVIPMSKVGTRVLQDRGSGRPARPAELKVQGKTGAVGLVDQRKPSKKSGSHPGGVAHRRPVKLQGSGRPKGSLVMRQDKRRVAGPGGSGVPAVSGKTWSVYVVVTLAAVVVVVMEAAYRILQFVTNPAGRTLHPPHHDPMATLTAALHRWHHPDHP